MRRSPQLVLVALVLLGAGAFLRGQESRASEPDDPKNPIADLRANKDENKRYLLIGPTPEAKAPKEGYRLLLVLPGSDGSAEFRWFVQNIRRQVLSDDYLVAELVAVKWKPDQTIVWPTKLSPTPGMKFGTEEFVADVVADVAKKHKIDKRYVFALGWSSSGHVIYNLSLADKPLVTGVYVAMAVFHPKEMPSLKAAKDRAYFIDHSPDDERCPFKDAEAARDALKKAGAVVELVTFKGGHGWFDDPMGRLRKGVQFLEQAAKKK
jgi:poly(3-hydroxybutyrate) depolymerase